MQSSQKQAFARNSNRSSRPRATASYHFSSASNFEEGSSVRNAFLTPQLALLTLALAITNQSVSAQSTQTTPTQTTPTQTTPTQPQPRSPGGDVGSGAGDIGKGAGKGTGAAAKGVGKGAGDLVTLHPIDAARQRRQRCRRRRKGRRRRRRQGHRQSRQRHRSRRWQNLPSRPSRPGRHPTPIQPTKLSQKADARLMQFHRRSRVFKQSSIVLPRVN